MSVFRATTAVCWFVLVISILIWTSLAFSSEVDPTYQREILIRHGLIMILLSMPVGLLFTYLFGAFFEFIGIAAEGALDAVYTSVICGTAGYIQWFLLLPYLLRKVKHIFKANI